MKIILSPNPYRDRGLKTAQSAARILKEVGVETCFCLPFEPDPHFELPKNLVYADMDSLRAMQTMDYPNSIENMNLTLYVEKYAGIRDDLVFQMGQEIHQINEYKAALHANKRKGTYDLKADLTKVYRPDGTDYAVKIDTVQFKNVRDMYTALHHFAALTPQKD